MTPFTDHRPPGASPELLSRFARMALRANGPRLVLLLLVIVFIIFAGGTTIAHWLFSAEALSHSAASQLQSSSGLFVMARGPARLELTPRPHIILKNVAFADLKGALVIEAPEVDCTLNLARLLAGRAQVTALTLLRPRAIVDGEKGPIIAPGVAMRAALTRSETPEAQQADAARLGVVNILDGALTIKRHSGDQIFERITLSLDWPRIGQPALIAGGVDWRGERHDALLWIARPGLLLRNDQSFLTGRLDGKNLNFEAQGFAALGDLPHFSGRLAGRAASAREALQLFDIHPRLPGLLRDAEFSAEAILDDVGARFNNLHVAVDGNALDGSAALRKVSDKLELSATLTSPFVSLEPVIADLPTMLNSDGQWSREPLDLPDLTGIDLNLRLEAAHARLGRLSLDHGSMSVLAHEGALDLALTQSRAYGGRMTTQVQVKPVGADAVAMHGVARTENVAAGALLWDAFGQQRVDGLLDVDLDFDAHGANIEALMHSLSGQANFSLTDGDIEGVNFPRALKLLSSNPLASAHAARTGRSRLTSASATVNIVNGVAVVARGEGKGDDYNLTLSGEVNMADRMISVKTVASEIHAASGFPDEQVPRIVFDLNGSWDDPSWRPDPQSFILRSGAAATLRPQGDNIPPPSP